MATVLAESQLVADPRRDLAGSHSCLNIRRCAKLPRPPDVPRGPPAMNPKTPTPVRAVVVDDVDDMRQLLRWLLEREGHFTVVAEADNGQSAVTAVLAHRPDLVLLDVTMPVMDGIQALKLIRTSGALGGGGHAVRVGDLERAGQRRARRWALTGFCARTETSTRSRTSCAQSCTPPTAWPEAQIIVIRRGRKYVPRHRRADASVTSAVTRIGRSGRCGCAECGGKTWALG